MTMPNEATWAKLQARYAETTDVSYAISDELDRQYQHHRYAPRGKQAKLQSARDRADRAWDAIWAFIEQNSPIAGELACGIPVWRIGREMTFDQIMNR